MFKDLFSSTSHYTIHKPVAYLGTILASIAMFFGAQFIPVFITAVILIALGKTETEITTIVESNSLVQFGVICAIALTTFLSLFCYLRWRNEQPLKFMMLRPVRLNWSQLGDVVVTYGLYFIALLVVSFILIFTNAIDVNQTQDLGIADPQTFLEYGAIFVMLVVLPPVFEEIFFRGFLFNELKKYCGIAAAAITVSILFGIAHLEFTNLNWIAAVDTAVFSMFLIYVSQKHKSLYSAIVLHAIKNGIAYYMLFIR